MPMTWLTPYIKEITSIITSGDATEFSYRTTIDILLRAATAEFGVAVDILQEPTRTKNIGAPDFRLNAKGGGVIGYVECKQPGDNLHNRLKSKQLEKYRTLSGNILLTDSLHWLLLRDGKNIKEVRLAEKTNRQTQQEFIDLLRVFINADIEKIGDAKRLAEALARRCAMLRDGLAAHEEDEPDRSRLHGLLQALQKILNTELAFTDFADAFAQTLVYSMLLAKLKAPAGATLTLSNLNDYIPTNFAAIRDIALFVQTLGGTEYKDLSWVADDILAIINTMDAAAVTESMTYRQDKTFDDGDDPYIYFYENFLAAYDAKQRERRGVYYTPPPVVKFIVRAVDDLLRSDFDLPNGLAESDKVTALDFAAGTGTFMLEMMRRVLKNAPPARRNMLTRGHLLKNFYGFELLIAPYAIAHLKLSQFLADNGAPLQGDERINIFLTNTLEQISKQVALPMLPSLAEEANRAQEIKDSPVLVITGNPPYSGHSQNNGEWIANLLDTYKQEPSGGKLKERNAKWINDDYVKFIRFAQWKMEQVEHGIVAVITNHSFLDNPTFRGMRKSLMDIFDTLYFLDLHGNSKKKETTPDGGKDENVFDIQLGVAISILIKNPRTTQKRIFSADLYGLREEKYIRCLESELTDIEWKEITPQSPQYFFIKRNNKLATKYEKFISVKEIFPLNGASITTAHDKFVIDVERDVLLKRFRDFQLFENNAELLHEKFNVAIKAGWDITRGKTALINEDDLGKFIKPMAYRPFDNRHIFYENNLVWRTVEKIMRHMLASKNLGLVTVRQVKAGKTWQHCLISNNLIESTFVSNKTGEISYLFPLYRYDEEVGKITRRENLHPKFRQWIDNHYGVAHTPEDILGCIYAILHSPTYRKTYADFLRTDFPRIPFPAQTDEFNRLATLGNTLIQAHLLRANCTGNLGELHGQGTSHRVDKVRYDATNHRLYFNPNEYLAPIPPEVFNFQIGGYHPLDKYLKSRKNQKLELPDIETLNKATNAIAFTIEKMGEIDV